MPTTPTFDLMGSYARPLADAVILLRYFEAMGEVRQAISVVKNRGGMHERTLREFYGRYAILRPRVRGVSIG